MGSDREADNKAAVQTFFEAYFEGLKARSQITSHVKFTAKGEPFQDYLPKHQFGEHTLVAIGGYSLKEKVQGKFRITVREVREIGQSGPTTPLLETQGQYFRQGLVLLSWALSPKLGKGEQGFLSELQTWAEELKGDQTKNPEG